MIRREEGSHFRVTKFTKICSRRVSSGKFSVENVKLKMELCRRFFRGFEYHFARERSWQQVTASDSSVLSALISRARNLNTSVVSAEEPANELPASVSDAEQWLKNSRWQNANRIHGPRGLLDKHYQQQWQMEQEIKELKRQLQCMQHQNDDLKEHMTWTQFFDSKESII